MDASTATRIFRTMLRIRRVSERIESEYMNDEMKTPVHLYIGQEAIASGVCESLTAEDYVSSNHRSHGHYLAKGGDLKAMMAELFCKATGCSGGYGGSMHLVDASVGHLGSSSIVGGGIPIGTGLGFAAKMKNEEKISVIFFGDGAADEGVLYESMNFAMLKQLPVIYVMENNGYSVCSKVTARHAQENVFHQGAHPDLLMTRRINGNDAEAVYETAKLAVRRARAGEGPSFIECVTYRILGHAGCKAQDAKGYREECEIEEWQARCPLDRFRRIGLENGFFTEGDLNAMEAEIGSEIDEAFEFARKSPLPDDTNMQQHLYCE